MKQLFLGLALSFNLVFSSWADLPKEKEIQEQLKVAKEADQNDPSNKLTVQRLEDTLNLLGKIQKQKADIQVLEEKINEAEAQSEKIQKQLDNLKEPAINAEDLTSLTLETLQNRLVTAQQELQKIQLVTGTLNTELSNLRLVPEKTQAVLNANLIRSQDISNQLSNSAMSSTEKVQLETEVEWIEQQNTYYKLALRGNNPLTSLYTLQLEVKIAEQTQLQEQITLLQDMINKKYLKESQTKAELLTKQQDGQVIHNPVIAEQVDLNVKLGQELVKQTELTNTLSQDSTRIENVLDNLQQTQRTINEQISALQGTLVLSRIINKQKNLLPKGEMIADLSTQITDLRVKIFDMTEIRDSLYDIKQYIINLEAKNRTQFSEAEKSHLNKILQDRRKLLSDMVNSLNTQLNLSMAIELNQKQVSAISDQLQGKLQQQSFWVRSNSPMNLSWLAHFAPVMELQLTELVKLIDFSNWRDDFIPVTLTIGFLLLLGFFIRSQYPKIEIYQQDLVKRVRSLNFDSQWNTPKAIIWSMIWCLPSALFFAALLVFAVYVCFKDPYLFYPWIFRMAGYWWFFAFMLAMLHPNGIAYRHFDMPKESVENARQVLRRSVWVFALWINASIFTNLETGIPNDVLGQIMTISVLLISLLIVGPRLRNVVNTFETAKQGQTQQNTHWIFTVIRIFVVIAPLILIALVVMGYYYTTLNLMDHLMSSYFIVVIWFVIRNVVYRSLNVSARRLAYNRLKEKREQQAEQLKSEGKEDGLGIEIPQEESLGVTQVKQQILRVTDLLLMLLLFLMLYWVWADLITVAYYLEGVTLWKQSVVTESGIVMESITLLNLLLAIVILIATYALVKNIGGLLEVLIFSRFSFSQGTPYTITTLITYLMIAVGAASAFSTLGISWAKLQWLFAGLSVGLGFGLQAIFANFVSGIIILFERPVRIGDVVTIGEFSGTVSKIRIRSTTLIDFDRKEVIIPNQSFVTDRLVNWALNDAITRVVIQVGVAYGSNLDLTKKLLLQAANECEKVLKDPEPVVYFLNFGASTLDHELRVFVGKLSERTLVIDFLNRRVNELFTENNIEIAFNQLDVFIRNTNSEQEIKISSEKPQLIQKA